jgi:hypothetical protein
MLVNSVRARVASVVTFALVALAGMAAPAAASTPVLADDQFKWFYWLGVILAASMLLWLLATLVIYYVRVIRPKHRGREIS